MNTIPLPPLYIKMWYIQKTKVDRAFFFLSLFDLLYMIPTLSKRPLMMSQPRLPPTHCWVYFQVIWLTPRGIGRLAERRHSRGILKQVYFALVILDATEES